MEKLKFKNWRFMLKALCCLMIIVIVTLICTTVFLIPHVQEIVQNNYNSTMHLNMDAVQQNIEYALERYTRMAYMISGNDEINRYLLTPMQDDDLPYKKEISDFLSAYIISDSYINTVIIQCNDGRMYTYSRFSEKVAQHITEVAASSRLENTTGRFVWKYDSTPILGLFPDQKERLLLLGTIKNRTDVYKNEVIATFAIEYDMTMLQRHFSHFSGEAYRRLEILNTSGEKAERMLRPGETVEEEVYRIAMDLSATDQNVQVCHEDITYYARPISGTDWILLGSADNIEAQTSISEVRTYLYMVLLIEVTVAFLVATLLAFLISKPLRQITSSMKQVENGELNVRIPLDRYDEFGYLAESFNSMMDRISNLIHEVYEVKASEKDAQIMAMRMQMNPHFLYNTLDAINWCISLGESSEASQMISCLGNILRYNVKGSDLVTMRDEVEQSINYLNIQQIRMGDVLTYRVDVSEALMDCKVMKFFLQPIVENAVLHGVSGCGHTGVVVISARIEENDLLVCVADNGNGIPQDLIPHILNGNSPSESGHTGIGVSNVHKRIRLYAEQERYGVRIQSDSGGTRIYIRMPLLL